MHVRPQAEEDHPNHEPFKSLKAFTRAVDLQPDSNDFQVRCPLSLYSFIRFFIPRVEAGVLDDWQLSLPTRRACQMRASKWAQSGPLKR